MDFRTNRAQAVKPREFEVGKRPRDEDTEALIQQAFEEQEHAKQLKKGPAVVQPGKPPKKPATGKTLKEIEDEEGGPVRESMVGMASTKRALSRKEKSTNEDVDTEFGSVHEVQRVEEELEVEQEEGIIFEPFNLRQEREEGFFDEEGNYVQERDDARDAWLDSGEAGVVSEAVRRRVAARQAALAAAEAANKSLSEGEIARMKMEAVGLMRPAETVTQALKRLGADQQSRKVLTKRERQRLEQQRQAGDAKPEGSGDQATFLRLTELADTLLSCGELDIYSLRKEILESEAALYRPGPSLFTAAAAGGGDDDDDDMFGDDDDKEEPTTHPSGNQPGTADNPGTGANSRDKEPATSEQPAAGHNKPTTLETEAKSEDVKEKSEDLQTEGSNRGKKRGRDGDSSTEAKQEENKAGAAPSVSRFGGAFEEAVVNYGSWPVKELRRFLQERGVDSSDIVEKAELARRVRELAEAGPQVDTASAPAGYVFEAASGYFYSADTGLHYDPNSGGFYQSSSGKWFSWDDSAKQFVDWGTTSG